MPYRGGKRFISWKGVTLSGEGRGLITANVLPRSPSEERPGGSDADVNRKPVGESDVSGGWAIEANAFSAPLLADASGERGEIVWGPEGNEAGLPRSTFDAYIQEVAVRCPEGRPQHIHRTHPRRQPPWWMTYGCRRDRRRYGVPG